MKLKFDDVEAAWLPIVEQLCNEEPGLTDFWESELTGAVFRAANDVLARFKLRVYSAEADPEFMGWSLVQNAASYGVTIMRGYLAKGHMTCGSIALDVSRHTVKELCVNCSEGLRSHSGLIGRKVRIYPDGGHAASSLVSPFTHNLALELYSSIRRQLTQLPEGYKADQAFARRVGLSFSQPGYDDLANERRALELCARIIENKVIEADRHFASELLDSLISRGADPSIKPALLQSDDSELAGLCKNAAGALLASPAAIGRVSRAILKYPGLVREILNNPALAEFIPERSRDVPRALASQFRIPDQWVKAILLASDIPRSTRETFQAWGKALEAYPSKYIAASLPEEHQQGLLHMRYALQALNAITGLAELYTDPGSADAASPLLRITAEAALDRHGSVQAFLAADVESSTKFRADVLAYDACCRFIATKMKRVYSNANPRIQELIHVSDLMNEMHRHLLRPVSLALGLTKQVDQEAALQVIATDILDRISFNDLIAAVVRLHETANLDQLISTASLDHPVWPAISRPRWVNLPDSDQRFLVEVVNTAPDLIELGRDEEHCVGTYGYACAYEGSHIGVIRDDHGKILATLELVTPPDGEMYIDQVQAAGNTDPPEAVMRAAAQWLRDLGADPEVNLKELEEARLQRVRERVETAGKEQQPGILSARAEACYPLLKRIAPTMLPEATAAEFLERCSKMENMRRVFGSIDLGLHALAQELHP